MRIEDCELHRTTVGDGVEIHYARAGAGDPVVFVHGGFGDWMSWAPQWEHFTARFHCITYSRRHSYPNRNEAEAGNHSAIDEARDLAELLDVWNVHDPVLIGTSYGAYTALQLALTAPGRVRALALTEPPILPLADLLPGGREARVAFERQAVEPAIDAFRSGDIERAVLLLTVGINGPASPTALTPAALKRRLQNANAMKSLTLSTDPFPMLNMDGLRRLSVPTLLNSGEETQPVHEFVFRSLSALMPHAQVVRVAGAGHGVHRDNPQAFNELTTQFVETLRAEMKTL